MAFPILAGLAMGALMGGGIAALQKKDILQGALMGGVGGALGGAFMPGIASAVGGEAVGTAAGSGLTPVATEGVSSALANTGGMFSGGSLTNTGVANLGLKLPSSMGLPASTVASTGATAGSGLTIPTSMATGAIPPTTPGMFSGGIGNFLTQNKGALAGGALGGMMAPGKEPDPAEQGNIRDYTFSQQQNPLFGQPGQAAFTNQQFTPGAVTRVEDYNKASGGIVALAEGGGLETQRYSQPTRQMAPEVAAYNAKLMERANQQYNVNLPPAPNQVPGSVGYIAPPPPKALAASTNDSISGLTFNPVTQQFEGTFAAPGDKKKSEVDPATGAGQLDNSSWASGDSSGDANGGLMRGYNMGGLSSLGSYSDGGQLLKGPGDGVSDDIPARIGARQPARLADGEFVIPARIVSEIGNGSTDAGAKQLYAMMDRVQKNRKKTVGKGKVAVDAKSRKLLPA
jgi:hypothetical protein